MEINHICVIGLGYIGLPTASMFAKNGVRVTGVDSNPRVVESLRQGRVHIHEPGLTDVVTSVLRDGTLTVASAPVEADAFIIAVPTPFHEDKTADLSHVRSAAASIVPVLRRGNLVVLESTSPPLTTQSVVKPILERTGFNAGEDFLLAYSPERVLPGQILKELVENARVIGGINAASAQAGKAMYLKFVRGEVVLTDAATSEMVKLMENTYRDVNIAIANEFSRLAERLGVDIWEAISIANRHPRVRILNPGPGVGGHCISVDPWFLVESAPDITHLIRTAREVNDSQPGFVFASLKKLLPNLQGRRVAALGLAYKPDVDDLRESPSLEVVRQLVSSGAVVSAWEPFKPDFVIPGVKMAGSLEECIQDAEVLLLLVNHSQLKALDPAALAALTPARLVLDTVNAWPAQVWWDAGFTLKKLGNGKNSPR